jgi:hypothetical protein
LTSRNKGLRVVKLPKMGKIRQPAIRNVSD